MTKSRHLALALVIVLVAFAIQLLMWTTVGSTPPWLLLYPAAFMAVALTDLKGGLLAVTSSTLIGWYFFVSPHFGFALKDPASALTVIVFITTAVIFVIVSNWLQNSRRADTVSELDAKFRGILDCAADAILVAQPDRRIVYANIAACRLLNYTQEEMVVLSDPDIAAPEDVQHATESFHEVLTVGRVRTERILLSKDGRQIATELNAVRQPDGCIVSAFRDITERKRAEQDMALLAAIAENSEDAIFAKDLEGRYLFANAAAERMTGRSVAEMLGRDNSVVFPAVMAERIRVAEQELMATGNRRRYEEQIGHVNGSIFVEVTKSPLHDQAGRVIGLFGMSRDISQRKRMEEALRASEERLRRVSENADVGLTRCSRQLKYVSANPAYAKIAGRPLDQIEGHSIVEVMGEAAMERIRPYVERVLSGEHVTYEASVPFADSGNRYLHVSYAPDCDTDGQIVGWVACVTDITKYRETQEALAASEARFRGMFDEAPIALITSGKDGNIELMNREFHNLFGYRREEISSLQGYRERMCASPTQLREQPQEARVQSPWLDASDDRSHSAPIELNAICKDGSQKTILLSQQRLGNDILTAVLDITTRKWAEDKVHELSQAIEQSPEAVVITDLDAKIQYVNDAYLESSGYTREELLGKNPRILNSGQTPKESYDALWDDLTHGRVWKGELINRRKDGSEYNVFAVFSPMRDSAGRTTHYVAIQQDITEKKRLGRELEKHRHHLEDLVEVRTRDLAVERERADAANLAKSTFLANMSHEIRTPMNGVLGMANLLRRTPLTEKQSGFLDKIEASGKHLLSIINDVLDISKIEAGALKLDEQDFNLSDVIHDVTAIIDTKLAAKGLAFHVDVADTPQSLHGDRTRLVQALVNYAGNAVKFTHEGSVTLACRKVEDIEGGYLLRFEVKDTGIGIKAENLARLFLPFEQADLSTTRQFGGTGLGLAITKRIALLMGGEVGVDSILGKGSTFWFTACLGKAPDIALQSKAKPWEIDEDVLRSKYGGSRILLVEDDPTNAEIANLLCSDAGLMVEMAENGAEAVNLTKENEYALILMDMQMPVMGGIEAAKGIRKLVGRESTPILAITANAFAEDRESCLLAGMNDFIVKPFEPADMFKTLLKWFEKTKG